LSAKNQDSLKQKINDLHAWLTNATTPINIEDLSYTLNVGRSHFNCRLALIVNSADALVSSLQKIMNGEMVADLLQNSDLHIDISGPLFLEIYKSTINSLSSSVISPEEFYSKMRIIADLYVKHYAIDWSMLHANETNKKIAAMPTYPFSRQRFWYNLETNPTVINQTIHELPTLDLYHATIDYLKNLFAKKLQLTPDKIADDETYEVYGIDSILVLEITNQLESDLGSVSKTLLYEKNTLSMLATYLKNKFSKKLEEKFNIKMDSADKPRNDGVLDSADKPRNDGVLDSAVEPRNDGALDAAVGTRNDGMMDTDIAIVGISGTYPLANSLDELWENLLNSRDCIEEVPLERWDYRDYPVQVGGNEKFYKYGGFIPDVDKFDPLFFNIAPRDAELMDPQERLFMQTAWETFEDAGYTRESLQNTCANNVGVFVGVTYNFYPLFIAEEWAHGNRIPLDIQLFSIANRFSYFMNLNGPSFIIDTACSSSLAAIHQACESILHGECKMAIAGGVNLSIHPSKYHMLGGYSFLSDDGKCRSFGEGGSGYVPSEGVGAVLLKPLTDAIRDNDKIYGVIKASSMNHGGKTSGYSVPNPTAQAELIHKTLEKAQIDPRSISYIEAHGTGTALGDPIEVKALQEAFEHYTEDKQFCAIGSIKSNIGHLESAAGISQLTKVLLQFKHKKLVPSIHSEKLNSFIDFEQTPFYVQHKVTNWNPANHYTRRAGISSFGAGGANIHLIVEEYPEQTQQIQSQHKSQLFILSANNKDRLQEYIKKMYAFLKKNSTNTLEDICYSLQTGREAMLVRLAILSDSYDDLLNKLGKLEREISNVDPGQTPKGGVFRDDGQDASIWFNEKPLANKTQENIADLLKQFNLNQLAALWVQGNKVNWNALYVDQKRRKVSLPTYPFAKRRCWIETTAPKNTVETTIDTITPVKLLQVDIDANRTKIINSILEMCSSLLGLEIREIDPEIPFQNYGMDSIIGINFVAQVNNLHSDYPELLSPMDLYRYPTVNSLVDYIVETTVITAPQNIANTIPIANANTELSLVDIEHLSNAEVATLLEKELLDLEGIL
jgi:acyl transferase domain-containing protein